VCFVVFEYCLLSSNNYRSMAQADWLSLKVGSCLPLMLHSSNELPACLCHDDSTINIDMTVTVAILY